MRVVATQKPQLVLVFVLADRAPCRCASPQAIQEQTLRRAMREREAQLEHEMEARVRLQMESRVQELEEEKKCSICIERVKDCVLSCGHQLCMTCAQTMDVCPFCNKAVTTRMKTFSSS